MQGLKGQWVEVEGKPEKLVTSMIATTSITT